MEKKENKRAWKCINYPDKCKHDFADLITENNIPLYGKNGVRFLVNFFRILVTCPECGTQQIKMSSLAYDIKDWLIENNKIKTDWKEGELSPDQQVNLKMHGVSSLDALHEAFPPRTVRSDKVPKNRLDTELSVQERLAYSIMLDGENDQTRKTMVIKNISQGTGLSVEDAELLYYRIMSKIRDVRNRCLKETGAEMIGDDNWW